VAHVGHFRVLVPFLPSVLCAQLAQHARLLQRVLPAASCAAHDVGVLQWLHVCIPFGLNCCLSTLTIAVVGRRVVWCTVWWLQSSLHGMRQWHTWLSGGMLHVSQRCLHCCHSRCLKMSKGPCITCHPCVAADAAVTRTLHAALHVSRGSGFVHCNRYPFMAGETVQHVTPLDLSPVLFVAYTAPSCYALRHAFRMAQLLYAHHFPPACQLVTQLTTSTVGTI
jgi:hypothetical protein